MKSASIIPIDDALSSPLGSCRNHVRGSVAVGRLLFFVSFLVTLLWPFLIVELLGLSTPVLLVHVLVQAVVSSDTFEVGADVCDVLLPPILLRLSFFRFRLAALPPFDLDFAGMALALALAL